MCFDKRFDQWQMTIQNMILICESITTNSCMEDVQLDCCTSCSPKHSHEFIHMFCADSRLYIIIWLMQVVEAYCLRNRLLSESPQLSSCFNSQTNETYASFDRLSVIQCVIAFTLYACVLVCLAVFVSGYSGTLLSFHNAVLKNVPCVVWMSTNKLTACIQKNHLE